VVKILNVEVDPTPELVFHLSVDHTSGALKVLAINQGWGVARGCHIEFHEPILDRVFSAEERQYAGEIRSGEVVEVLSLTVTPPHSDQVRALIDERLLANQAAREKRNQAAREERIQTGSSLGSRLLGGSSLLARSDVFEDARAADGIELRDLSAHWRCQDEKGRTQNENARIPNSWKNPGWPEITKFLLKPDGFENHSGVFPLGTVASPKLSDGFYITIIDLNKGPHQRGYPISREILPGGIDRFHIVIGSRASCTMRIRFEFLIGRASIESKEFEVRIWNPRDLDWEFFYKDGDDLFHHLEQLKCSSTASSREIESLKYHLDNYPFNDPGDLRRYFARPGQPPRRPPRQS
jgi:hypothetical protein